MLIRNRSTVEKFIRVRLDFDDGTTKKCDLKKGDMGHFVFRWNNRLIREFGRVKEIKDDIYYRTLDKKDIGAIIILDTSHSLESEEYKIQLCDLVDIDLAPAIPVVGPGRGKLSMKVSPTPEKKRRCKSWPVFRPRNEKKLKK